MSRNFLSYHNRRRTLHIAIFAAALAIIGLTSVFFATRSAYAGGAGGDGGTGTGGNGSGYSYIYKYGWYVFDVNGNGPSGGFRNSTTWPEAQAKCNAPDVNASQIVAFVYRNSKGDQKIYTWLGENNSSNYAPVGPYITAATANGYYNAMGGLPNGIWGTSKGNVGWFCYNTRPKPKDYTLSATSTANLTSAKPGDTIRWTHQLSNGGPDVTTQNTHSNLALTGFSNGWGVQTPTTHSTHV